MQHPLPTIIDAHHHLWQYAPAEFDWISPGSIIADHYLSQALAEAMATRGVTHTIAVQSRQIAEETQFLCGMATTASIAGVVGWIDLQSPEIVGLLDGDAALENSERIVGYRHVVQDEPDSDFLLRPAFVQGVRAVVARDLTYDILINRHQLGCVPAFLDRIGGGRFVLDHAAKPDIAGRGWQPWADEVKTAARYPDLFCKVSGLVTEADHENWLPTDFERYLDHVFDAFGPDRILWGSDWPVCLLAADYAAAFDLIDAYVLRHCPSWRDAVFRGNAVRAYALRPVGFA